jgi:hypothetical protein
MNTLLIGGTARNTQLQPREMGELTVSALSPTEVALDTTPATDVVTAPRMVYVSNDAMEIDIARIVGYDEVVDNLRDVANLQAGDWLVVDCNFLDRSSTGAVVNTLLDLASCGVLIGLHTYNVASIVMAKNHMELLRAMANYADRHGHPSHKIAEMSESIDEYTGPWPDGDIDMASDAELVTKDD